jgi:hypothetical protein
LFGAAAISALFSFLSRALEKKPPLTTHTLSPHNTHLAEFCCNGTVVEDPELGQVIQLQGDQRKNVTDFLVSEKLVKKELIKIHGF